MDRFPYQYASLYIKYPSVLTNSEGIEILDPDSLVSGQTLMPSSTKST